MPCIERCQRGCTPGNTCCDGVPFPNPMVATITATTGGCSAILGFSTTLTDDGAGFWRGVMDCIGELVIACTGGPCANMSLTIIGCPSSSNVQNPTGSCFCSDPFEITFVFTAGAFDIVCGPCCGSGVGGSFTIVLSE